MVSFGTCLCRHCTARAFEEWHNQRLWLEPSLYPKRLESEMKSEKNIQNKLMCQRFTDGTSSAYIDALELRQIVVVDVECLRESGQRCRFNGNGQL